MIHSLFCYYYLIKMNIVFFLDKGYLPYLEVTFKSLFYHHTNLNIYILTEQDFPVEALNHIQKKVEKFNGKIYYQFSDVLPTKDGSFPYIGSLDYSSKISLLRLFLCKIMPKEMDKILYLDCDLIATKPLDEL